jgi:hypothetical protein
LEEEEEKEDKDGTASLEEVEEKEEGRGGLREGKNSLISFCFFVAGTGGHDG